jgi:radical SAM superfamily enzyme YgiQ (UPF0313 family)
VIDLPTADPEPFFAAIEAFRPTLVAASTYIWSVRTFLDLAARVRRWDPDVRFVMGGPAVRPSLLDLPPYRDGARGVDAIVTGEGEEVVAALARHHRRADWLDHVPGLLVPHALGYRATAPIERPTLDDYASPYELGRVPPGLAGFVETFRGCPIHCEFCQWGEQKADRVHGADYLERHLRGLQATDAATVFFVDAAFNLSPRAFRNVVEAERRVGVLRTRAVHGHLYPTFLKEEHLEFFDRAGYVQAAIGIQSFDEAVLDRLGRPFDVDRFEGVLRSMRGRIPLDVEIIFGLPGDNPASFRQTLERSLELADEVSVFYALALPDALIERAGEYAIDFDPETFRLRSCEGWTEDDLSRGWEELVAYTRTFDNHIERDTWVAFSTEKRTAPLRGVPMPIPHESIERLASSLSSSAPAWSVGRVHRESSTVFVELGSPHGTVVLEIEPAREGGRQFSLKDGVAYSHRGELPAGAAPELRRVIDALHADAQPMVAFAAKATAARHATAGAGAGAE